MSAKPKAVGLPEAAKRLGFSYNYARQMMVAGTFPIPTLKRHSPRAWHKFSEADIERHLASSTADARKGAA